MLCIFNAVAKKVIKNRLYVMKNCLLLIAVLNLALMGYCQEVPIPVTLEDKSPCPWSLLLEEDFLLVPISPKHKNQDRNYTGGIGVSLQGDYLANFLIPLKLMDRLLFINRLHSNKDRGLPNVTIGSTGFTPDSLLSSDVIFGDRPYASIVYISTRRTSRNQSGSAQWSSELSLGILGTNFLKGFQTVIHRSNRAVTGKITPYDPQGWHNQISDGGEATGLYGISYAHSLLKSPHSPTRRFRGQAAITGEATVGHLTAINTSLYGRIGVINSFSNILDFRSNQMSNVSAVTEDRFRWELYIFGTVRPYFIAHNSMLNGQFKASEYYIPYSEMNRFVLNYDLGIGLRPSKKFSIYMVLAAGRTPEFNSPKYKRSHHWGSIYLNFNL